MIVGYVILLLTCAPGGQYCSSEVFAADGRQIYTKEFECEQRISYYQSIFSKDSFSDDKYLTCGEVQR